MRLWVITIFLLLVLILYAVMINWRPYMTTGFCCDPFTERIKENE
tara:strand:+ start:475 stop:609 length:135 start_codon:yes stop_codon:yes gene_type:complete